MIDEVVVGALYTEFDGSEFSFDVIVTKDNQSSGIGKELTLIAMSEYDMYTDMGNVKLMLDVVNPRYAEFLINQYGLSIVDNIAGHITLTDKPDESSMTESVHSKFISFVEKFSKYDPILVESVLGGYKLLFESQLTDVYADANKIVDEATDNPDITFYHATYRDALPNIMKYGLGSSTSDNVPEEWLDDIVIFSIDSKDLDISKIEKDPNLDVQDGTYLYKGIIPANKLTLIEYN